MVGKDILNLLESSEPIFSSRVCREFGMSSRSTSLVVQSTLSFLVFDGLNYIKTTTSSVGMMGYFFDKIYCMCLTVLLDSMFCNNVMTHQLLSMGQECNNKYLVTESLTEYVEP